MKKKAFTLIELLVVIAIIAVLMGILMPSLKAAREQARGIACASNLKTMILAWTMYAEANDGTMVPGHVGNNQWVSGRVTNTGFTERLEQEKEGIRQGLLWPYIKQEAAYRCPSDSRKTTANQAYRSYSIAGAANGQGYSSHTTGNLVFSKKVSDIKSPSTKYIFLAETDPRGFNGGSWIMNADKGNSSWIDPFAIWHSKNRTTLAWADGRAQMQRWVDNSTLEMSANALDAAYKNYGGGASPATGFYYPVPADEGEDLEFMARGYPVKIRK